MGNDLLLPGNLAGSNKSEEVSFNFVIELSRCSARCKQQCKDYCTFELICAVVHSSPEPVENYLIKVVGTEWSKNLPPPSEFLTRNENVLEFQIHRRSDHSNMCSSISLGDKIRMSSYIKLL